MNSTFVGLTGDGERPQHRRITNALQLDGINDYLFSDDLAAIAIYNALRFESSFFVSYFAQPSADFLLINSLNSSSISSAVPWNAATQFDLSYGGAANNLARWGWQRFSTIIPADRNNTGLGPTNSGPLIHFAIQSNSLAGLGNRITLYLNGRIVAQTTVVQQNISDIAIPALNKFLSIGYYDYGAATFINTKISEMIFVSNYAPTAFEIRQIYNNITNDKALHASCYSSAILTNRVAHYTFNSSDFEVVGLNLFAKDVSGNNRHLKLFGQGTTPTIVSFY